MGNNRYECWFYGCQLYFRTLDQRNRHFELWHPQIKVELEKLVGRASPIPRDADSEDDVPDLEEFSPDESPEQPTGKERKKTYRRRTIAGKRIHKDDKLVCHDCGRFVTSGSFEAHRDRCTSDGQRIIKCPLDDCSARFETLENRRQHVWAVHKEAIPCPIEGCPSSFKPACLARHMKSIHHNVTKMCDRCGKQVRYLNFSRHQSRCSVDRPEINRPFICPIESCGKEFAARANLNTHSSMVHREPIKCPVQGCDRTMKPKSLKTHLRTIHEGEDVAGTVGKAVGKVEEKKREGPEKAAEGLASIKHKPLNEVLNYNAYRMIKRKYMRMYTKKSTQNTAGVNGPQSYWKA